MVVVESLESKEKARTKSEELLCRPWRWERWELLGMAVWNGSDGSKLCLSWSLIFLKIFCFFGHGSLSKSLLNLFQYCFYFMCCFLALRHVGSYSLSNQGLNLDHRIGRWSLTYWTTREVPSLSLLKSTKSWWFEYGAGLSKVQRK